MEGRFNGGFFALGFGELMFGGLIHGEAYFRYSAV